MARNILQSLDDAMRVNVTLMDEATIDNTQLLRLLELRVLRQSMEVARVLFTTLGGSLPVAPTVAPVDPANRFARIARLMLLNYAAQKRAAEIKRDPFAKAFTDLLAALAFARHIARNVRDGIPLRNHALVAQRVRGVAELYRTFRLQAWLKLN